MWGLACITKSILNNYSSQSISYVLDSQYLDWNTTFPAIFVCPIAGSSSTRTSGDKGKIEENVGKFVYESTKRVNCDYNTTMEKLCEDLDHDALMSAYYELNVSNVIEDVSFLDSRLSVQDTFKFKRTQIGPCFVANQYDVSMGTTFDKLLKFNRTIGPGSFKFLLKKKATIFILPPEAIPLLNTESALKLSILNKNHEAVFTTREIWNDRALFRRSPEKRLCRFPNEVETPLKPFGAYSLNSCQQECMNRLEMTVANCTTHLMPEIFRKNYCGYKGLQVISELPSFNFEDQGITCRCLRSCYDFDYEVLIDADIP
ncbi:uncharacterized protein LOC113370989 [Ctenocephalides felis]|uniref:uncharacterized protein LOC113370989 n=1 Tax=Ctenocephalides felis TaxID=7515 RepID=UPI000E6E1BBE|nr:uncharacterized protein LOC113370989 [Ctenocephalides felis]